MLVVSDSEESEETDEADSDSDQSENRVFLTCTINKTNPLLYSIPFLHFIFISHIRLFISSIVKPNVCMYIKTQIYFTLNKMNSALYSNISNI